MEINTRSESPRLNMKTCLIIAALAFALAFAYSSQDDIVPELEEATSTEIRSGSGLEVRPSKISGAGRGERDPLLPAPLSPVTGRPAPTLVCVL